MIEIKAMNFTQFDEYQDYIEELEDKKTKQNKISRCIAIWIMKHIYDIDVAATDLTPGQIMSIVRKTVEATLAEEQEQEKN